MCFFFGKRIYWVSLRVVFTLIFSFLRMRFLSCFVLLAFLTACTAPNTPEPTAGTQPPAPNPPAPIGQTSTQTGQALPPTFRIQTLAQAKTPADGAYWFGGQICACGKTMFEMSQEVDNLDASKESEEVKAAKAEALFQAFTAAQKTYEVCQSQALEAFIAKYGEASAGNIDMDKFGAQGFDDAGCAGFMEVKKEIFKQ